MTWNLIIQSNYRTNYRSSRCLRSTLTGLAQPAQIHLVSCDDSTDDLVGRVTDWIEAYLDLSTGQRCVGPGSNGSWAGGLECQAFGEPACIHVLVFFKGFGVSIDNRAVSLLQQWKSQAGTRSEIIVVVPSGEGSRDLPKQLRHYHRLTQPSPVSELGLQILRAARVGARRKIFLSYRRQDTRLLADQIHQELTKQGFQVYVDRFSWMPGRLFPDEIAEELADKGVVLLLESSGLHLSRWTQWELAFARTYHLGILALNVDGAPQQRGISSGDRHDVSPGPSGELSRSDLEITTRFLLQRYSLAELRRRVFFEALVRQAASAAGGSMKVRGDRIFEVSDGAALRALVLPSGRPANLEDLAHLGEATMPTGGAHRILAGQHRHLPPSTRQKVHWLAPKIDITLRSTFGIFSSISNLLQGGRP